MALEEARQRLTDAMLERALLGSFHFSYEGGELTGHARYIDSRLGYAMLCRLDQLAES